MTSPGDQLAGEARAFFQAHAARFDLRADAVRVRTVLSRGGFVNHSFRISDGPRSLHLKLAVSTEAKAALTRWHSLGPALERYRAPPILDHVEIGGASGLVFPALRGGVPAVSDEVLRAVFETARGLWSDRAIASRLPHGTGRAAATCYVDTYHDRFTEDLRAIAAEPPPFLDRRDLDDMTTEVERLREEVEAHPSFRELVSAPVHGDLWLDNVVWESEQSWHIVDWDDLRIGDPAMDVAMLTGPTPRDPTPLKRFEAVAAELDPGLADRVTVLGRASLLDWVIDPLADWIEAGRAVAPDRAAELRREKERIHRSAYALYRRRYVDA